MSNPMSKIAIIGGGIAGLACARVLAANSQCVQVFDKGRGPGGRMSTRRATTTLGDVSFDHGAQYFTARNNAFAAEIAHLIAIGAVGEWKGELVRLGSGGLNSPLANEALYVGQPGMNGIVRALAQELSVSWGTRVEGISKNLAKWHLTSETGENLGDFDQIVCAVPAEQVTPLIGHVAADFAQQGAAIKSLPCWAGMFAFDQPLAMPFDAIRLQDHPILDFIAMNSSKPDRSGPAAYVVHAHADWSEAHLEETAQTVASHLESALLSFSDNRPAPIFASAHRWRYARVETAHGPGHLWDDANNIGVCGDWLSGPRVESAWLSGHHLGMAMTASLVAGE